MSDRDAYLDAMMMASPCVNLCQIDPRDGLCLGCARTSAEIGRWLGMNDEERRAIMAELPQRRQDAKAER